VFAVQNDIPYHIGQFERTVIHIEPERWQDMSDKMGEHKKELRVKWIKAKSGTTYLCPVNALDRLKNPSEADLKMICVDESQNPQND